MTPLPKYLYSARKSCKEFSPYKLAIEIRVVEIKSSIVENDIRLSGAVHYPDRTVTKTRIELSTGCAGKQTYLSIATVNSRISAIQLRIYIERNQ